MRRRTAATILLCAAALGACGGGSDDDQPRATSTTQEERRQADPSVPGGTLALPAKVPLRAIGDADPGDIRVIRLWSQAMSASRIDRATSLWTVPATVQNGTPVVRLATRGDVRLFNDSLSCGSQLVSARSGGSGFTIAVFKLTKRPRAECTGVGNDARVAIFVRDGRIAEWYRLPADPDAPAPGPAPGQPGTEAPEIPEI